MPKPRYNCTLVLRENISLVYLKNNLNGPPCFYECISFWNKEKKRSDSNRTCIGKLDPVTGEIIKSKRAKDAESAKAAESALADSAASVAEIKIIGSSILFDHICKDIDLNLVLKRTFPNDWQMILSLAYFLALTGKPLSKAEHWSRTHQHPYQDFIDNQRISEFLLTITDEKQLAFFKLWAEKRLEEEYLVYDNTSISAYSELNEMVRYGYNRDGDSLPQINLAMLFGEKTHLPVFYKSLPGSINEVSTLHNFLKTADFLNIKQLRLVMDKRFFSKKKYRWPF
ncbi:MAG: transposase [Chlamydiae bacterium]|nr:transposase [Chlamydiota bacterium]